MIRRRWEVVRVPAAATVTDPGEQLLVVRRWRFVSAELLAGKLSLLGGPHPRYTYEVRERS